MFDSYNVKQLWIMFDTPMGKLYNINTADKYHVWIIFIGKPWSFHI